MNKRKLIKKHIYIYKRTYKCTKIKNVRKKDKKEIKKVLDLRGKKKT